MKDRTKQTIITIIIAVLGFLLIATAFWMYQKKFRLATYVNHQAGFSVKYPPEWSVDPGRGEVVVGFTSPLDGELDVFKENVNIAVQDKSYKDYTLETYSKLAIDQMKFMFQDKIMILTSERVHFAGQDGYKFVYIAKDPNVEMKNMHFWTLNGKTAYLFTYGATKDSFDRQMGQVKRMIRSFKILNRE